MAIIKLRNLLDRREISPFELYHKSLKYINAFSELNAFNSILEKDAEKCVHSSMKRFENHEMKSPLDGIPIAVKDNFNKTESFTTCSSRMLLDYKSPYDATVVEKLMKQGSYIIGKTNMDEFAMGSGSVDSHFGPVKNPWSYFSKNNHLNNKVQSDSDDYHIAGGSSGGSAVAVAAGMCSAALGSDTGGSVRIPAAFCGVVGLKPSYGRLSRHGLIPLVNSMDVPGIITKNVDDCSYILNVLSGHDAFDATSLPSSYHKPVSIAENPTVHGLRVGIPKEYDIPELDEEMRTIWRNVADRFENSGAIVKEVSLPHTAYSIGCYSILSCSEVASNMARYDGIQYGYRAKNESSTEALYAESRKESLNEVVRSRILAGNYFLLKKNYEKYYMKAMKLRRLISEDFVHVLHKDIDVLLTPCVLGEAPLKSRFCSEDNRTRQTEVDVLSVAANLAGIPAVSVPICLSKNHLPLSLQLIAPYLNEPILLNTAKWLEIDSNFSLFSTDDLVRKLEKR